MHTVKTYVYHLFFILATIAHNFGDMVCESLLKPVNNGEWSQWNARWNGNLPKDNG